MRNALREAKARESAQFVREHLKIDDDSVHIGVILGTGWGDTLNVSGEKSLILKGIPGFESLGQLEGHARRLAFGTVRGQKVFALRGRIHLNEAPLQAEIPGMVRLQAEMLFQLGVRTLIVTSAAGSLREAIAVGSICIIDGFVTVFAPEMPLWAGEFCSPEDTLDPALRQHALEVCSALNLPAHSGGYAMLRGPFFEGRRYDKHFLQSTGASVVGMSTLPETCIAALYGVNVLGLSFITNSAVEEHSHEENIARAKKNSQKLGGLLEQIVARLPQSSGPNP